MSRCLPMVGILLVVGRLVGTSASNVSRICRRRSKTWQESKLYILQPFEKRGEMDQGIGCSPYYSLIRVARAFCSAS